MFENGLMTAMLVELVSRMQSEEEMVDQLIDSLNKYKLTGYKKEERPMMPVVLLTSRWMKEGESLDESLERIHDIHKFAVKNEDEKKTKKISDILPGDVDLSHDD